MIFEQISLEAFFKLLYFDGIRAVLLAPALIPGVRISGRQVAQAFPPLCGPVRVGELSNA
jgi:hypothetical protein